MSTYTQILYHIVFGTKNRNATIDIDKHDELYRYIGGVIKNHQTFVFVIGGYSDHIHILSGLHPSIALADMIKDIKLSCSTWIKEGSLFPSFSGWQDGYGAFTCSWQDKERVINYIQNQFEHHRYKTFEEEYKTMLERAGIEYDEKYLL